MKKILFYFDPTVTKIFVEKTDESGEKKLVLSSPHNFVYTAEIVARIIEIENDEQIPARIDPGYNFYKVVDFKPLKADSGIFFDQTANAYKSKYYGFVIFDGAMIKWLSPLNEIKDKTKAFYTIFPTKHGKIPTYKDIEEILVEYKIRASIGQKKIEEALGAIKPDDNKLARIVVAQGKAPVKGHEEYFIPLVSIDKKAGEIKDDGSIDFKETGSIIQIVKNQEILKRVPEVKPVDGFDIYGNKVPSVMEEPKGYSRGDNIVKSGHDELIYVSSIDGCLDVTGKTISVLPVVYIKGDVNYESGNIDFNGSVHIRGSVLPGFSVKATGDINIDKSVDDAFVEAGGDITIKMGITGKEKVKVVSRGNITAKFILNANVEAAGNITVEDSIINSEVFSNNTISVIAKHGKIIGGNSTALYEIAVNVAGAIGETETILNVGRNLYIEKELALVFEEIAKFRGVVAEVIRKLKTNFGEGVFENPKEYLTILSSVKKKNCIFLLKELSDKNKELKSLVNKSKEIQAGLKLEKEPVISIRNKIYPGTVLNIKKNVKKIDSILDNVKFYEDPNDKVIRFTPAI